MFFGLAWLLPHRLGLVGAVLAHLAISIIVFSLIVYDILRGAVQDPDFIWMLGNLCWTAIANLVMLPVTLFAMYRRRMAMRPAKMPA